MSWANLTKLLSGVFLAIALIVSGCFFAAQHVIAQFTAPPPKPTFPNDNPGAKPKLQPTPAAKPSTTKASPKPSVTPTPSPKPTEAAGYRARITLSQGLNLRESPSRDSARIGGVASTQALQCWKIARWSMAASEARGSGREGWVKAGYTERVNP
jgi:hypothetical protein